MNRRYAEEDGPLFNLIQQIKPKTVDCLFIHGLGDCIMFCSAIKQFQTIFPDITFKVATLSGQELIFKKHNIFAYGYINDEQIKSDLIFDVRFPMQPNGITKGDYCCEKELGIPEAPELYKEKLTNNSKLLGLNFHNTALPHGANPDEKQARDIWDLTKKHKFIPIEVHFIHVFANPINSQHPFIDFSTRKMECNLENLINIISSCSRFIGVNSGPFFCALSELGINNTAMIEKDFPLITVVKTPGIKSFNVKDHDFINKLEEILNVWSR